MSSPIIYAVTVNWNLPDETLKCIVSLHAQEDIEMRLVVVDNGSIDDSVARLRLEAPDITLIETGKNLGFAGGYNAGIRYCIAQGAEHILIINNDTLAHPKMVKELIAATGARVAAIAPIIYYADAPELVWSQGSGMNWLLMEQSDTHGRNKEIPVALANRDFLSGCCLLVNTTALGEIGLLDEGFFLYYEDLDWSVRIHKAGWMMRLAPEAKLWHKVALSSKGSNSPNERYWMGRSSIRYFRKHVRGAAWLAVIPWRLGSAIKTCIRLSLQQRTPALLAYFRGIRDGLRDPVLEKIN